MACHSGSRRPELSEGANLTPNPSEDSRTDGRESLAGGVRPGKIPAFSHSRGGGPWILSARLVAERQDGRLFASVPFGRIGESVEFRGDLVPPRGPAVTAGEFLEGLFGIDGSASPSQ